MFYFIKSHSAAQAYTGAPPWDQTCRVPEEIKDKEAFRRWCQTPNLDHYFYTAYEGLSQGLRVSDENAAVRMHGVVADFDSPVIDGDWEALKLRGSPDFQPSHGSLSFSNQARLVWTFEEPVFVYDAKAHEAFLRRLEKELKLAKLLPGFDKEAFHKVAITYECGHDWRELGGSPIPSTTLAAWLFEAGKAGRWSGGEITVPISRVADEVEKKWPGRWQGEFAEGSRGLRFWDLTADNGTACVVREGGMQCFTGDKGFLTWREILGHRFVEEFQESRIAQATGDLFFDGRHYWRKVGKFWQMHSKEDTALHFKAAAALRADKERSETASEVEMALYHVQTHGRVNVALPLVHQPPGVIFRQNERILNTSCCEVVHPAPTGGTWGEGFGFIASYLDGFFTSRPQLDHFLSWLKRFYESAYNRDLRKGQALFIAGPPNTGKTLLSTGLICDLLGGGMDASEFLLGRTSFNSSLYSAPVWTVDDSTPGADAKVHASFSANVKRLVANENFEFLAKFRDAQRVRWVGRIIVTLNDDAESMRILPDADTSILDKAMLFRASDRKFPFPPRADYLIRAELPAFARWLLDGWVIPEELVGEERYGVKSYHDEGLLGEARRNGRSGEFVELLSAFRESYFSTVSDEFWEGTSTALIQLMSVDESLSKIIRAQNLTATGVGRELSKLQSRGYSVKPRTLNGTKRWRINKEGDSFEGDGNT